VSLRIVFFGTPQFSAKILAFLLEHNQEIIGIVTRPDKPKGRSQKLRPSAVKEFIQRQGLEIPLFQPEKASTESFASQLKNLKPDLFVVVAYGEIIKTNILEIPPKGCINIHASLLPKYRGAAPIQRCLMEGEKETGVTIMEMVLKMDAGDILETVKIPIGEEMTFGELEEKLCEISGPALLSVLKKIEKNTLQKIPQDREQATFAPKITWEDRIIHWEREADELHNQIRALSPNPGAFCYVDVGEERKKLLIKRAKKTLEKEGEPGETLSYGREGWVVACGSGALSLLEVQLEGKKTLPIESFIHGYSTPPKISTRNSF